MENRRKRSGYVHFDRRYEDTPTYSRLFIVCDRNSTEDDFRQAFSPFGTIEDIYIPCDQNTGMPKGIVFIKFSKTSEAAEALEKMNYRKLPNYNRCLKVMVAANKSEIQSYDINVEKYKRLFVHVPRTMTENELEDEFRQFGRVESVLIQRDRETYESKGFAYIKYRTFLEAALAFEQCNRSYRCIFAQPKNYNKRNETAFETNLSTLANSPFKGRTALISSINAKPRGYTCVLFMCAPYLSLVNIKQLFDIVPGMVNFSFFVDLLGNHSKGKVQYSNPMSAAHAVEKLNNFEYPPGSRISVKPDLNNFESSEGDFDEIPHAINSLRNAIAKSSNTTSPDLAELAGAIAEASKLIRTVTSGVNDCLDVEDLTYCSVQLPAPQPLAPIDSPVAKRCFLVCYPQPPPLTVLRDVFCRFGNLINAYALPNKTVGYAQYATVHSADSAIRTLHGAEVYGVRMKVLEAEEEVPTKRTKFQ